MHVLDPIGISYQAIYIKLLITIFIRAMSSSNTIICILIGCLGIVACKMNQKEALMACLILALSNLFGQALQLLTSLWSMLKSIECSTLCSCGGAIGYLISWSHFSSGPDWRPDSTLR